MTNDGLLNIDQVAKMLSVKRSWIYSNADRLPTIRIGRQLRWKRSDVEAWLDEHRI